MKEQQAKLDARIQAAKSRNKRAERKQDIRREILIRSYYFDKTQKENNLEGIKKLMDGYLTRDSTRKLFDLAIFRNEQ